MGVEDKYRPQNYGRIRITTDQRRITERNVREVLMTAYNDHLLNRQRINFLIEYERGNQPLQREKKIRPEINVEVIDNLASEIVEFKTSYKWGNKITYKQRGNFDISDNDTEMDNTGISEINEMLNEEDSFSKDAELGYYVETCGVGYQMVDIKRNVDGVSVFDLVTLNPLNTFVVYDNTVFHRPLMGVTYVSDDNGNIHFTCITDEQRFEILNLNKFDGREESVVFGERNGEMNPMHMVPIAEFIRSNDRMGCFERQISSMDALNILESDFCNNVAQDTQSLWWGDNLDLPPIYDENGKITGYQMPRSGGWFLTDSSENKKASVQPLVINTQYEGILSNVKYQRDVIKQRCFVPILATAGGGSTGTAMSMSSGWETAEVQAQKEESYMQKGKMMIAKLILAAIRESTETPKDSAAVKLKISDIQPSILRDRNYDMSVKANTLATLVNNGIDFRHAIEIIKLFPDTTLVYNDSKPSIELYYEAKKAAISRAQSGESGGSEIDAEGMVKTDRTMQDSSDQITNSPILGGMNATTGGRNGAGVTK